MNSCLVKQIGECPMVVFFSDIFMSKMEEDVVVPSQTHFYKRYVDDSNILRKKNCEWWIISGFE